MADSAPTYRLIAVKRRSRLKDLRTSIEAIYRNRLHTHFTDHSIIHCDRVAAITEELLGPLNGKFKLTDDEGFVLYGGCYLHDIGMHNEKAGEMGRLAGILKAAGRDWTDILRDERLNFIRIHHHEISADMVVASVRNGKAPINFTLTDADRPAEIAAISEAHCVDTAAPRYDELTRNGETSTMRLRLLSAVLRLADVLDEAHHRALVEQAQTLDLNLESRMHWWRHYYTREIEIEPEKNRITIWFDFPAAKRDQYAKLIPSLQMPWIEQEFSRHRAVLAENGLSWHIGWQIKDHLFKTLEEMPPEVEGFMLQELARRKHIAAQKSRVDLMKQFDHSRARLMEQLKAVENTASTADSAEYLSRTLQLTSDLWQVGSRLTAYTWLSSALFYATNNGRSVPPRLNVHAATELARMQAHNHQARDSVSTLINIEAVAKSLDDVTPEKVEYYRIFSSVALHAGYYQQGSEAAREAIRLLGPGAHRDDIEAELAEAKLLEGKYQPVTEPSEGEV